MGRRAGASTRQMAASRRRTAAWFLLLGLLVALGILAISLDTRLVAAIGLPGFLALLLLTRLIGNVAGEGIDRQLKRARQAERGARAEEDVSRVLERLANQQPMLVFHDVATGHGNIDHVVITPHGVFVLETKSHHGRVEIAGERLLLNGKPPEKDFIAQALGSAYWLKNHLRKLIGVEVWVNAVVIFTHAFVPRPYRIKGVRVANVRFLPEIIAQGGGQNAALVWEKREVLRASFEGDEDYVSGTA